MRHMHDYGTTSEQLAWIKVAASHHAQYNPHAMLKEVVTVEDVLNSPMISDPAAPDGLLRRHRRRRRDDRHHAEIAKA
jgi:acetyl-CoA acetyltransferase